MIPCGKNRKREEHKARRDLGLDHMADFLEAVRTRRQPAVRIDDAFRSTATVQLAMIAYETGEPVQWNESTRQITGNPAGAQLLKRPYRLPWQHPYPGA